MTRAGMLRGRVNTRLVRYQADRALPSSRDHLRRPCLAGFACVDVSREDVTASLRDCSVIQETSHVEQFGNSMSR